MKKKNTVGMVMVEISLLSGLIPNTKDLEHVHILFFLHFFFCNIQILIFVKKYLIIISKSNYLSFSLYSMIFPELLCII